MCLTLSRILQLLAHFIDTQQHVIKYSNHLQRFADNIYVHYTKIDVLFFKIMSMKVYLLYCVRMLREGQLRGGEWTAFYVADQKVLYFQSDPC